MSSVTHLTQHLLRLDPAKSVARQTLFNYLKVYIDGDQPLTTDLLNDFFAYALNYQYWQINAKIMGESLANDLEQLAREKPLGFSTKDVRFPHLTQFVVLNFMDDWQRLLHQREESLSREGDRHKLIAISDQQILAATLKRAGGLEVRVYGRVAWIVHGQLVPIRPITELFYNSELELENNRVQILEGPMVTAARFRLHDDTCVGMIVRGHTLQRYETLNAGGLQQHSELFYGLKRIERHFINPASDPFHQELVTSLERSYQLLQAGHPEGKRAAAAALQRGKAALKHIFPNDKLLTVLITNIEFSLLGSKVEPWAQSEKA